MKICDVEVSHGVVVQMARIGYRFGISRAFRLVTCLRCGYEQPWAGACECEAMAHVAPADSVYEAVDGRSFEFRQKCRAFRP